VETGHVKSRRGFAAMSPEKQREIASKGGRVAHQKGAAHQWTADEAREAGRKGGSARHAHKPLPIGYGDVVPAPEPWSEAKA